MYKCECKFYERTYVACGHIVKAFFEDSVPLFHGIAEYWKIHMIHEEPLRNNSY